MDAAARAQPASHRRVTRPVQMHHRRQAHQVQQSEQSNGRTRPGTRTPAHFARAVFQLSVQPLMSTINTQTDAISNSSRIGFLFYIFQRGHFRRYLVLYPFHLIGEGASCHPQHLGKVADATQFRI